MLGVTGALATYPPGKASALGPVRESAVLGPARMELTVDPAAAGVNELHLYFFDRATGAQWDRAEGAHGDRSRGATSSLPLELRKAGPGPLRRPPGDAADPRATGRCASTARVSDFDQYAAEVEVPVR